jgi:cytochrome P450
VTQAPVRRTSSGEQQAFTDLMRATGAHIREEYHERLAGWRALAPVHEMNFLAEMGAGSGASLHEGPIFSVLSHREFIEVGRNPEVFSSAAVRPSAGKAWGKTIITEDPPEHTAIRSLVQPMLTRKSIDRWKAEIFEPLFRSYVDSIFEEGSADLHKDVFLPFPVTVIHHLLGIDDQPERAEQFHELAIQLFMVRGENVPVGLQAADELFEFFSQLIVERRQELREGRASDDLATMLIAMNDRAHLVEDDELARFFRILLPGASDTTTNTSGNLIVTLLNHPAELDKLRADPELVDSAIEEIMRYEVISAALYRGATEDVELGGVEIPQGAMVMLSIGAANRDPARFKDPDRFDVTRAKGGHVGFGHGIHACVGHFMARAEMSVALRVLLERMPRLRADPDFEAPYVCGALYRHPGSLHVRWD